MTGEKGEIGPPGLNGTMVCNNKDMHVLHYDLNGNFRLYNK